MKPAGTARMDGPRFMQVRSASRSRWCSRPLAAESNRLVVSRSIATVVLVIVLCVVSLLPVLGAAPQARGSKFRGSPSGARPSAAISCSKDAAADALLGSPSFLQMLDTTDLRLGEGYEPFSVVKVACHDFTGDGRRDMAVLLMCCTAASPTPLAIFQNRGDRWRLRFSQVRRLVYGIRARGPDLILRSPHFEISDPLCCPSSYRHYRLRWAGNRFVLRRIRAG